MRRVIGTVISDVAQATRHLLSGLFLLSGFNVCIALGALFSGFLLRDPERGIDSFHTVMGFEGTGFIAPIPDMMATLNWCTLATMAGFAVYSFSEYLSGAARRSQQTTRVVAFPAKKTESAPEATKKAANS